MRKSPPEEPDSKIPDTVWQIGGVLRELTPLDFSGITGRKRKEYFAAIKAGLDRNYEPMERIFNALVRRTLRN